MPGIEHTPSAQNVATTSSVRPSSSAWVYAAIVARTLSTTSAKPDSGIPDSQVDDRAVERVAVDLGQRGEQVAPGKPGEVAVDRALEVRDVTFEPGAEPHVLEAPRVQAA